MNQNITKTGWDDSLVKGKFGEELILRWFGGEPGHDDILLNIEVKNTWKGKEIFIEEMSMIEINAKGWLYTTKADCIIFVNKETEQAFAIQIDELRIGYDSIKDKFLLMTEETIKGTKKWHSNGRWIPLEEFSGVLLTFKPSRYVRNKNNL